MPATSSNDYSESELRDLLRDPESDLVERKRSLDGDSRDTMRNTICAFANDLQGKGKRGVIFVGVADDGSFSNLEVTDELLTNLANFRGDGSIVPPPVINVGRLPVDGHFLAFISVLPSDVPPVRCRGITRVRVGPTTRRANAQEERILVERRSHLNQRFDARPLEGTTLADLDERRFEEEYLPQAVDRGILSANDRTLEERLAALKMIASVDNPVPTGAGILVLGKEPLSFVPGAYVQFLRVDGTELSDPVVDEKRCDGTISEVIKKTEEKMDLHILTGVEFHDRPVEKRNPSYPLGALQQLVRNAVMHRNYEGTNTPVKVNWFTDRVEITNPGGPFGTVTVYNFGEPGRTDYRNVVMAEAMRVLGLVQRFGAGIPLVQRELEENRNPKPKFQVEQDWVQWTVRTRQ